ncbi:MAG: Lrp/AsnC family transcriptional regulator [Nitrososphaerales archaeon]
MSGYTYDLMDLMLLKRVCSGYGVEVNIAGLSRRLGRHKNTIRDRVKALLSYGVIDRPVYPFKALFQEYPLLVISYADLPYDEKTVEWLKNDKNIFAAYRIREGESNTVIFEFHKDVWDYHLWREKIVREGKIPERSKRAPSHNYYFSNKAIFKYEPSTSIELIEREFQAEGSVEINGYKIDEVGVQVLKALLKGEGVRINESLLAKELKVSRRSVINRLNRLEAKGVILNPLCRFPHFFVPPNYLLVLALVEVRSAVADVSNQIIQDPHVTLAYHISEGRYNMLLFGCYKSVEDYLRWEDLYAKKYPGCLGSIKISFLSPKMTIHIDQQKVSLGIIEEKLREIVKS